MIGISIHDAQYAADRRDQRLTAAREYRQARLARGLPLGGRRARQVRSAGQASGSAPPAGAPTRRWPALAG